MKLKLAALAVLPAFGILLLSPPGACADAAADKEDVLKLEKTTTADLEKTGIENLTKKLADDWKLVGADGSIMTREQLFETLKSGKLKFSSIDVRDLEVRLYGDAAVVIGINAFSGTWDGEQFSEKERFTDVFIRKDGQWRCVSTHASGIKE